MAKEKVVKVTVSYERRIPLFKKKCPVCGKTFEGASLAKYCSDSCRGQADYARHSEERRKKRREKYRKSKR